jgi:hypothetical protein
MSRSVVPDILELLLPWLEARMTEFNAQSGVRTPTLPDNGGKVDLRALIRQVGIKAGHEQHFYRKPELQLEVNAAAEAQGLLGIGSRAELDASDKVAEERLTQAQRDRNDYARALAEAHAQIERLRRENASLRAQLDFRSDTGMTFRTAIAKLELR